MLIFCKILPAKDCIRSLRLAIRWVAFKRRLPAIAMPAMPLVSWWAVPLRCDRFRYPNDLRIYPFQRIWNNPQIIPNGCLKLRKSENPANFFKNLLGIPVFFLQLLKHPKSIIWYGLPTHGVAVNWPKSWWTALSKRNTSNSSDSSKATLTRKICKSHTHTTCKGKCMPA